jgi:diguanylate cyclase (GGDEF)-like protein
MVIFLLFSLRIRNIKARKEELEQLVLIKTQELKNTNEELLNANSRLEQLSLTDALTKLPNRRNFELLFSQEWNRCMRDSQPLSLLMIDIDYFKYYNDTYGHPIGDDCLQKISAIIKYCAPRVSDFSARLGGEEFIVVLPNTPAPGAGLVAERLRSRVEEAAIAHKNSKVNKVVTISIGVGTMIPKQDSVSNYLLDIADQALYQAKKDGRNRYAVINI